MARGSTTFFHAQMLEQSLFAVAPPATIVVRRAAYRTGFGASVLT